MSRRFNAVAVAAALCVVCLSVVCHADGLEKQSQYIDGKLDVPIMLACTGRIMTIDKDGVETKAYSKDVGNTGDGMILPNGNILFSDGDSVVELTPDHKEVMHFCPADRRNDSVFSAIRLDNGNTLVGWNTLNKIIEIDPQGNVVSSFDCQYAEKIGSHHNMRNIRLTPEGTILVAQKNLGVIAEYTRDGKLVQTYRGDKGTAAFGVCVLKDGTVAGAFLDNVIIFDRTGKEIWRFEKSDAPEISIAMMCPIVERKNGNLVIGNYAANRGSYHGAMAFEITRDKKVVWQYCNPQGPASVQGITVIE